MRYSEYANEWLVEFHKGISDSESAKTIWIGISSDSYGKEYPRPEWEVALVGKLVDIRNDNYMRPVWNAIRKRMEDEKIAGQEFYFACTNAYDWGDEQKKTPRDKRQGLLAISKKARELAVMTDKEFSCERSCGYFALVESIGLEDVAWRSESDGMHFDEYRLPSLGFILNDFANKLEIEANIPPVTAKPNSKNAHRIVFVRRLTESMRKLLGQPLRRVVANTACVIFDTDDIDEKFVRDNARN